MRKTLIIDFLLALTRSYYVTQENPEGIAKVDSIIAKKAAQENVDDHMKDLAVELAAEVELDLEDLKSRVDEEVDELLSRTADESPGGSGSGEENPGDQSPAVDPDLPGGGGSPADPPPVGTPENPGGAGDPPSGDGGGGSGGEPPNE